MFAVAQLSGGRPLEVVALAALLLLGLLAVLELPRDKVTRYVQVRARPARALRCPAPRRPPRGGCTAPGRFNGLSV